MINLVSVSQALLVAEHLSFSRAAQVLGVRQSAVSRRVRALEDALGVSLFERESTGVRLTEAGRRFLERARPALSEIDHAVKAAASAGRGAEGVLRIGILSSVSGGFMRDVLGHYHCVTVRCRPSLDFVSVELAVRRSGLLPRGEVH